MTTDERLAHIEKTLYTGNGQPPLVSQLATVRAELGTIKRLLWIVVGTVVPLLVKAFLQGGQISALF